MSEIPLTSAPVAPNYNLDEVQSLAVRFSTNIETWNLGALFDGMWNPDTIRQKFIEELYKVEKRKLVNHLVDTFNPSYFAAIPEEQLVLLTETWKTNLLAALPLIKEDGIWVEPVVAPGTKDYLGKIQPTVWFRTREAIVVKSAVDKKHYNFGFAAVGLVIRSDGSLSQTLVLPIGQNKQGHTGWVDVWHPHVTTYGHACYGTMAGTYSKAVTLKDPHLILRAIHEGLTGVDEDYRHIPLAKLNGGKPFSNGETPYKGRYNVSTFEESTDAQQKTQQETPAQSQ